ncbi:MAG TPA: glucose-6-phosphate isomerase [Desulfotignum sp.]|nr:glucose-6-phosphate isomerase [Desulfotignum sp.]
MYDSDSFMFLQNQAARFDSPQFHVKQMIKTPGRLEQFSLAVPGFFFDFSRQRLDQQTKNGLVSLAKETQAKKMFSRMVLGDKVNATENRAALHTAARALFDGNLVPEDADIMNDMKKVNQAIDLFSAKIHQGHLTGTKKKPFTDAVVVGIGGSYLGCEFVYEALKACHTPKIALHFLSNVDIDNFAQVTAAVNPDTCLWIIVSKSYTTTETLANLAQAKAYLKRNHLLPRDHLVTITAKGSPGDDPSNPVLESFDMFDFIGGRYSVSSAVGGVPLALAFGYDVFERFLKGCHTMDSHALCAAESENIPLMAALVSIWNIQILGYSAQAVIPYSSALSKLAPHVQQLYMESLGKAVDKTGTPLPRPAGSIVFGEPGTNAQHSFFQLAHQGPVFPVEFIGVLTPGYAGDQVTAKGVFNHQELWANLIAQTLALAEGMDHEVPARAFLGNRPSSLLVVDDLSPESIGMLLSFYEARTVFEGFILNINPFDQFGVELGKVLASGIRKEMADKNQDPDHSLTHMSSTAAFYIRSLFAGKIG